MDVDKDIVTYVFENADFAEILENITKEVQLKNYRVTKITNVDNIFEREKQGLLKKSDIAFKHYKIVGICNLMNCNSVISSDLRAGVFMPVRLVVYQPKDKKSVHLSYLKPTAFAKLFQSEAMMKAAEQLEMDLDHVAKSADF